MEKRPEMGISLPTSFLNDNYSSTSESWHRMFGSSRECLDMLRSSGVESIEINDLHMNPPLEDVEPAIEKVLDNGFSLTVHIFLPEFNEGGELPLSLKRVCRVLKRRNLGRSGIPLTTHGHSVNAPSAREGVREKTINDLRILMIKLKEEGIELPLGLELCRDKKGGPIGVTYREVLGMAEDVRGFEVGICWDLGHTLYNVKEKGWNEPLPAESFLDRVIHTHIHDLAPDGKTHSPLNEETDLLFSFLNLLKGKGYRGVYNLELYPYRWPGSSEERRDRILRSIGLLQSVINSN